MAVPIQPVVLAGQEPWAMFDDLRRKHHWVLKPYEYSDRTALIGALPEVIAFLLEVYGIGYTTAAKLLVAVGDNPQRIRTEAAFAHLCGVAPIPASSGKTMRHRLNRGGNRQANSALYHIVLTRMKHHQPTRDYVARRLKEGKTMGEIARILKRYVARQVFKHLPRPA